MKLLPANTETCNSVFFFPRYADDRSMQIYFICLEKMGIFYTNACIWYAIEQMSQICPEQLPVYRRSCQKQYGMSLCERRPI